MMRKGNNPKRFRTIGTAVPICIGRLGLLSLLIMPTICIVSRAARAIEKQPAKSDSPEEIFVEDIFVPSGVIRPFITGATSYDGSGADPYACDLESAVSHSCRIVVAEYKRYEANDLTSFYDPPSATCRLIKVLKGDQMNKEFPIWYFFMDGTQTLGTEKPKNWRLTEGVMPKKGSKWILFITSSLSSTEFDTYRGSYGRMAYSNALQKRVEKLIQAGKASGMNN